MDKGVPFGFAVELLRNGYKLARYSWDKGRFISLVDDRYLAMHSLNGAYITGWSPCVDDIFSSDWHTVEADEKDAGFVF